MQRVSRGVGPQRRAAAQAAVRAGRQGRGQLHRRTRQGHQGARPRLQRGPYTIIN